VTGEAMVLCLWLVFFLLAVLKLIKEILLRIFAIVHHSWWWRHCLT